MQFLKTRNLEQINTSRLRCTTNPLWRRWWRRW